MKFLNNIFSKLPNPNVSGLTDELKVQYINYLSAKEDKGIIILTSTMYEATKYYNYLKTYKNNVFLFPMDEFLTSVAIASSPDLKIKRLETLNNLKTTTKPIVVTNLTGFLKFVPNNDALEKLQINIKINQTIQRENFEKIIDKFGYNKTSLVTSSGEYSIRGYIIDIYPYNLSNPIRIELFGNEIESIKEFNIETQRSINKQDNITILPYDEIIDNGQTNIYELMNHPLVIKIDPEIIEKSNELLLNQIIEYKEEKSLDKTQEFMFELSKINIKKEINISTFNNKAYTDISSQTLENFNNNLIAVKKYITQNIDKYAILLYIQKPDIILNLKEDFTIIENEIDTYEKGKIYLIKSSINQGFILQKYLVISENDIIKNNFTAKYHNPIKVGRKIKDFNDIKPGDYVVHRAHGIGIYNGVITLKKKDILKDYLQIQYTGNDKIYVPVEKINTIYKYSDADGIPPKINSLNSTAWTKTKNSIKAKIKDISKELLKLYAERSKLKSPKYKEYPEELVFASKFAYTETKDQTKCIKDILSDLKTEKPMDRLLCGDVGFGKTEVAFRAVFNTIMNGYQVAYLCPTTILSKQQYQNALERFKDFPINIEIINRFTSQKDFTKILTKLENGQIDLLLGTHKLFNAKIKFKNLGLLIIDEEQRFGVSQKEKIKELAKNINILTLSATPIPRTLKMAMSGLKDLSILDTPPEERYPVQTYVVEQNDALIKEVIYKEMSRNGQVYYLYNNVSKIETEKERLQKLIPDAKICYTHGQMPKEKLETIIEEFIAQKYDILVCTTIIETGIDIPNVNTLIVNEAQNYGLSQLYQLRGRVGRSNKIAYAYLVYDNSKLLNEVASKRLKAIKEFTELGSGYKIAMRDLSIRGAGDLLGSEQAGFIDSVGIELYTKLIEETLKEIKGEPIEEEENPVPLLDVDTHIKPEYVEDESIRIEIHQLINQIKDYETLTNIKNEIEDRFGKIDDKMEIYMYEEWFEKLASSLGINHIIQTQEYVEITLPEDISSSINGEKLFLKLYNINPKFKIKYIAKRIIINLPIKKLDKHYLYYLVEILEQIKNDLA